MDLLNPREPVSTWSHGLWLLLALPGVWLLWSRSGGDRGKRVSVLIYGLSLVSCSGASTLYHGVRAAGHRLGTFALLDYIGIYFLIAGSYTPIVWTLMRGRWRSGLLVPVWLWAVAGSMLRLDGITLPPWLSTGLYLLMGWWALVGYVELARRFSFRTLLPIPLGGLLYSLGAVINLLKLPVLWPGVIQAHELFHLLVVAGSLVHFWFVLSVVLPYASEPGRSRLNPDSRAVPAAFATPQATGRIGG